MEPTPESRRAARREVDIACEVVVGDETLSMRCEDLSPYGMWLAWPCELPVTDATLALGDEVAVTVPLPGIGRELTVFARVQREGLFGMGVEIIGLSEDEREALEESLRGIPPRFPRERIDSGIVVTTTVHEANESRVSAR